MPDVVDGAHVAAATKVKRLLAAWHEIEDLVNIGAYAAGSNPEFDLAVKMRPSIETFLKQGMYECAGFEESRDRLLALSAEIDAVEASLARSARQNPSSQPKAKG
jgi:flagellar biosynthesis/type III secretory pathway ATPase